MTRHACAVLGALLVAVLAAAAGAGPIGAQQPEAPPSPVDPDGYGPIGEGCSAPEYRAFDFWLGEWSVEDREGTVVGSNTISRISNGCALLEHWIGGSGVPGQSLNHYDPAEATWHQRWVGGNGQILDIQGGLEGDAMVLSGERSGDDGVVIDRITWSPEGDGSVRQKWDISQDGGETWQEVFLGIYRRAYR